MVSSMHDENVTIYYLKRIFINPTHMLMITGQTTAACTLRMKWVKIILISDIFDELIF